jgi:hypothetical protein
MPVVNIFHAGWLAEPGSLEQAPEPLVVTIGFLILHQQPDKFGVGEFGMIGAGESLLEASGHAKELQGIESGYGLFAKHDFPPD